MIACAVDVDRSAHAVATASAHAHVRVSFMTPPPVVIGLAPGILNPASLSNRRYLHRRIRRAGMCALSCGDLRRPLAPPSAGPARILIPPNLIWRLAALRELGEHQLR